jgi:hypothetical protein
MNLKDKAADVPEVSLSNQLTGSVYEIVTDELVEADELTPEGEFPQYGDFLKVHEYSPVDDTDRGETHIEVPRDLAQWIVEKLMPSSDLDKFRVVSHQKIDGEHRFECETVEE